MKKVIKQILRENTEKNILGITVTRPNQELIIMRGISGSGKSTMAKSLVKGGVIHSTDDLIEATGDYNGFFAKMIEANNFADLSRMHSNNLKNAMKSMDNGISPVIIDNTNLRPSEAKPYVMYALEIGYADDNIKIVDVGTGGLSAEALAARNSHGVPLENIQRMINTYNGVGPLTLNKIIEASDMYKSSNVLYSCVLLDDNSRNLLLLTFADVIPNGWKTIAHHMTIVFGKGIDDKNELGKEVVLTVTNVGWNDKAIAVLVDGYPSKNANPHITLAINPDGGKPKDSNEITDWKKIRPFKINGVVTEIKK